MMVALNLTKLSLDHKRFAQKKLTAEAVRLRKAVKLRKTAGSNTAARLI
jgi:hypothetical protein